MSAVVLDLAVVRRLAERAHVFGDGETVAVETDHGPAHAHAAAELRLDAFVRFAGLNTVGHAIYRM